MNAQLWSFQRCGEMQMKTKNPWVFPGVLARKVGLSVTLA
jgi:hypothetical protein